MRFFQDGSLSIMSPAPAVVQFGDMAVGRLHENYDFTMRFESTPEGAAAVGVIHESVNEFVDSFYEAVNDESVLTALRAFSERPVLFGKWISIHEGGFGASSDSPTTLPEDSRVVELHIPVDDESAALLEESLPFFVASGSNPNVIFGQFQTDWYGLRGAEGAIAPPPISGDLCIAQSTPAGCSGIAIGVLTGRNI